MPDINSVTVCFKNGQKREEYGPTKAAEVSITAAVGAGEDGGLVLDLISQQTMAKVALMLDAPKPATLATSPAQAAEDEASVAPRRRGRPPKDETQAPAVPAAAPADGGGPGDAGGSTAQTPSAGDQDEWAAPAGAPDITDKELLESTSAKAQALGNSPEKRSLIMDLIGTYNPNPDQIFKVQNIAQPQRRDYLAKLNALV